MTDRTDTKSMMARGTMAIAIALSLGLVPLTGCVGAKKTVEKPAATQTQKTTTGKITSRSSRSAVIVRAS